ncbi:hypothetical protein [Alicyclobacillus mali (ex Roth et al. 2021)]|uniref:hypothetical protein n=1 Tax=Alicyclobacillus mali (ex Roth et al. 2021) TaxID=1123961 RepID=UPI001A8E0C67|nr:hypothetical protein [Alicyclobacillus mali (ex Roth et al. 2021)]
MLALLQRVPDAWMALLLGCVGGWAFLKLQPKDRAREIVADKLSGAVLVFVVFTRFSGILLHPSLSLRDNLMAVIGGTPPGGIFVGLAASTLYLIISLWRKKALDETGLKLVAQTLVVGAIPYFAYRAYVDLHPYRFEDLVRCGFAVILYLLSRRASMYAHRVWAVAGTVLFGTSLLVPHVELYTVFDLSQWTFLLIMAASISVEAWYDVAGMSPAAGLVKDEHTQREGERDRL